MATQATQKILRVGVIQNGRIVEERLVRTREPVSVGQKLTNTLVLASDAAPASHVLFDVRNGRYVLQFNDRMTGKVALRSGGAELGALKTAAGTQRSGDTYAVEIDDGARGKIAIGETTVLFQFVNAPPLRVLPQLPANMRGTLLSFIGNVTGLTGPFLAIMIASIILQGGGVAYLVLAVPPPPRTGTLATVPDRFVQIMRPEEEPPEPVELDPSETEPSEDGLEVAEAEEPAEEPAEQQREEPETRTREELREIARTQVIQQSALGALYNSEDGVGPALDAVIQRSGLTAADVIQNQTARGVGGSGIVSSTGVGTSSGAEGTVDRAQISGGGSELAEGATVAANTGAEAAEVRVNIRGLDPRTGGSGRLDDANLQSVLRQRNRDIQRCYERGLARDPELSGRFMLEFTIGDDGRVTDARLAQNELGEEVGTCIVGAVRRWRFDAPSGGSVTVRRPYILQSGG